MTIVGSGQGRPESSPFHAPVRAPVPTLVSPLGAPEVDDLGWLALRRRVACEAYARIAAAGERRAAVYDRLAAEAGDDDLVAGGFRCRAASHREEAAGCRTAARRLMHLERRFVAADARLPTQRRCPDTEARG